MRVISLIVLSALMFSCEYINNLTADGEIITSEFKHGTIQHIIVNAPCRIILHNSNTNQTDIEGYDYLLEDLELTYRNDSLIINHSKKDFLQRSKLINLNIPVINLQKFTANKTIQLNSSSPVEVNNLKLVFNGGAAFSEANLGINCNQMSLFVYGNNNIGDFHLNGKADKVYLILEGIVNIDALDIKCNEAEISHKSIGSCGINVTNTLNVKTYSSGNTYYKGDPAITHQRYEVQYLTPTGSVIKID